MTQQPSEGVCLKEHVPRSHVRSVVTATTHRTEQTQPKKVAPTNTKLYLIVLPLLLLAMGAFAGCIRNVEGDYLASVSEQNVTSDTHLPTAPHTLSDHHVTVDPRLLERFKESEWVRVAIGVTLAPEYQIANGPHDDAYEEFVRTLDWELFDQSRADRWADVVSALGPDFQQRLPGTWITASGLEKLRDHPFVFGVGPYGIDPIEPLND